MNARPHIVFDPGAVGARLDELAFGSTGVDVRPSVVEVVDMTRSEAADARRGRRQIVVEAMPMALIAPVARASSALAPPTPPAGPTWGVEAVGALTSGYDGTGVCVALLDTGIDASHLAFQGMDVDQRDFTDGRGPTDDHGTHCAGTILGRDVEGVRIGVAPGVTRLLDARVIGGGSAAVVDAVAWAVAEGAHVISMSLGIDFIGFVEQLVAEGEPRPAATSQALASYRRTVQMYDNLAELALAQTHLNRGALLIAAAGNASQRGAATPYVVDVEPPAASQGIVSVTALGREGDRLLVSDFSNVGAAVTAPGVDIWSAVRGGGLGPLSGTSMAAPHVAGVAALWAQRLLETHDGRLDPRLLDTRLRGSCRELPDLTLADVGGGLVQAPVRRANLHERREE